MSIEDHLAAAHEALHRIEEELRAQASRRESEIKVIENYPMAWVKLERYTEISGDTVDAVQARRKAGKWLNGKECKLVDGRLWINLPAVGQWIERWE
jgi:hypothetical protein